MVPRWIAFCATLVVAFAVTSSAWGGINGTIVRSNTTDENRKLLQEFILIGGAIDYHIVARDRDGGLYPYCVTARLERRSRHGWRPLAKTIKTHRRACFETPSDGESDRDTFAAWDTFIYPTARLLEKLRKGKLRLHGSTDLGGKLIYRR